ncbi:acetyl-CoA C-acetyltransferase [Leptospira sp. 2 VSF19]|uniref:Acetyl-CoA C-acetyltransferase n=1 Tax=Leptospira soteropolitanensis TaxID=2950025 RepID=A0AAW5VIN7_9LEPT|nr:acetyl-CoA C-acetyltransferase [Leptospira soteropolitanensis]MCW7491475.1 acetyl-CoA C-acetyltransferase [Leptospira soteropolitanensis]MCW7499059.1 acetyl-CoA C-acetyltransferase [Leptospira soteropolitanensis]MCW7521349.1 acetyl-CoA C-acetyltransferase [Leptospira soteropolitanensis]MCW7525163.1 acetyl-CoA C-acetyltransferase [Leptospira soteropolitanensis]MCW7529030.1 acetyl-CoA C-acetyltransferase [Leptospira soteropolitanensis]
MGNSYIIDAVRTPRGKGKKRGTLASVHPQELAAATLKAIQSRTGIDPKTVEEVVMGCVSQVADQAACIARYAVMAAHWPKDVPGYTVNRFCGSGLQALNNVANHVGSGAMELGIGGGVESMSRVKMGDDMMGRDFNVGNDKIASYYNLVPQGISADLIATKYDISREEADRFAESSQQKAHAAIQNGHFKKSVIPITLDDGTVVTEEENPRLESDYAFLSSLGPVFKTIGEKELDAIALRSYPEVTKINHIHTLGNSSGIVDGAAAILVTNDEGLKKYGLKPRAKILATVATGEDPTIMLTGPVSASQKALKQAGLSVKDIDLWEINEAFASVVLYVKKTLGIDESKINVNGGAIALGHPLGATGAILTGTVLDELERRDLRYGLITLCIGGGMGIATIIERLK